MPQFTNSNNGVSMFQLPVSGWMNRAGLRTSPSADNPTWTPGAIAMVFGLVTQFDGNFLIYAWDPTSVLADDAINVIKPTAITGAGRWRLTAGTIVPGGGCTPYMVRHYGSGSPEGVVTACLGEIYVDVDTGAGWKKAIGDNTNTGWSP